MSDLQSLAFIVWNPDPDAFSIGSFNIRWYGILFGLAFLAGYLLMGKIFRKENVPQSELDALTLYMVVSTFAGARLGQVFFYEPGRYLQDPLLILNFREGGLASHGAAIGIITGMWLYSRRKTSPPVMWVLDRIVIMVALSGLFIRMGNLMNSEIVGNETRAPWGFIFVSAGAPDQSPPWLSAVPAKGGKGLDVSMDWEREAGVQAFELWACKERPDAPADTFRVMSGKPLKMHLENYDRLPVYLSLHQPGNDNAYALARVVPRHPAQLYEAFFYLLVFFLLWRLYFRKQGNIPPGQLFGIFLVMVFGFRFLIEFLKADQVDFEAGLPLNMGQLLSIPFIAAGIYFLRRSSAKRDV